MTETLSSKILSEYQFLGADLLSVEEEKGYLRVYLLKEGRKIKSYKLNISRRAEIENLAGSSELSKDSKKVFQSGSYRQHGGNIPIVLVVEDDPDQSKILEMMLKDLKYQVLIAGNGEEALTQAADCTPDLIITDIMMPKMDGVDFIKKIKRNPAYQNIPVLVLTVLSDPEKEYDLLKLGIDDYCQKTMQRNILMKRIENLVNRHLQFP